MIIKAVTLFLIGIMVLGLFGRLRTPKLPLVRRSKLAARKCKSCGAPVPGQGACPCQSR